MEPKKHWLYYCTMGAEKSISLDFTTVLFLIDMLHWWWFDNYFFFIVITSGDIVAFSSSTASILYMYFFFAFIWFTGLATGFPADRSGSSPGSPAALLCSAHI